MMADGGTVLYRVDGQDTITFVNHEWDLFAVANAAPDLLSGRIVSRSLWDFVSDATTRQLYRDMLKRNRAGHGVRFPFRCDAADWRRFLEMDLSSFSGDAVEFQVRTLSLEKRPSQALLEVNRPRTDALLRMCGWCKRVAVGVGWVDVEEAVLQMRLFESASLPMLTHGICEECEEKMNSFLDEP
jgi:hypothetical protein